MIFVNYFSLLYTKKEDKRVKALKIRKFFLNNFFQFLDRPHRLILQNCQDRPVFGSLM